MKTDEKLSLDLVWQSDGHVSDVVVTCAADGQEHLLPAAALDHLAECECCVQRIGEAAAMSMQLDEHFGAYSAEQAAVQRVASVTRPPLPVSALVIALVLAALGAVPALSNAPMWLVRGWETVLAVTPHLVRGGLALARAGSEAFGPALWLASMLSVLVLFLAGLAIARTVPRPAPTRASNRGGGS